MKNKKCTNDEKCSFLKKLLKIIKKICNFLLKMHKKDKNESEPQVEQQPIQQPIQQQQYLNVESPVLRPNRRTQFINFNKYFNSYVLAIANLAVCYYQTKQFHDAFHLYEEAIDKINKYSRGYNDSKELLASIKIQYASIVTDAY